MVPSNPQAHVAPNSRERDRNASRRQAAMIDRARTMKRGTAGRDVRETQSVYLGLRRRGLSIVEAGNLTARLEGIHAVPGGWTLRDVERLQFLGWLITSGRFGADDMGPGA